MTDARALAERMFDILDNGRYDEFTAVVTEDVVKVELQVTTHSAAEWAAGHQAFAAAVPDTKMTITRCVQDGDDFAVEGYFRGTHSGPLQLPQGPIPATGRQFELRFCAFGRLRGDRISEVHVYFDMMSLMAQLGLVPDPATALPPSHAAAGTARRKRHLLRVPKGAEMPRTVITYDVADIDRWLKGKAERAAGIGPAGTNVTDYVALDGSNHVAVTADIDDLDAVQALLASPPAEVAAQMKSHGVRLPITVDIEK